MSGKPGHTGHTGTTGRKGLQGTPYGAPGTTFYSTSGRVNVTAANDPYIYGTTPVIFTEAGGLYAIQSSTNGTPQFVFPSTLTSDQYGTFWTITNQYTDEAQRIYINSGIYRLTIPGGKINCPQGQNPNVYIDLGLAPGQSISFVFFAGSNTTAEYIAF